MESRFQRISELFEHARQWDDTAEREAYLESECDPDLRAEVDALLAAYDADRDNDPKRDSAILPGLGEAVSAAWSSTQSEPAAPDLVEGFRVIERIGSGGMGTVYAAEQIEPRRRVALKVLRPEADRDRFRREVLALARLQHPGIAQILLSGECATPMGTSPFLAMELIDGVPVDKFTQALDRPARIELIIQLCEAVAHAHRRGIIHRDLKPNNILVTKDGQPKVLDFGLAMATDDSDDEFARQTKTGHLVGTLAYMSPEQANGARDAVDTRADVYALGVLAYEILTGRLPHSLDELPLQTALRTLTDEDPETAPDLRGDLWIIIRKALAKDPEQRYGGAGMFAADLRRFLDDEPIAARPPSAMYQARKFVRRHKAPVAGLAATLLALIVGLVMALRAADREAGERQRADREREVARAAAAHAYLQAAAADARTHKYGSARTNLAQVAPEFRDWEWDYLAARVDRSLEFRPLPEGVRIGDLLRSCAAIPESRFFAGHDLRVEQALESGTVRLIASDGEATEFTGITRRISRVRIGLNGKRVILLGDGAGHVSQRLYICDREGGAPLFDLPTQVGRDGHIALDPTGTRLLFGGFAGRVMLFDIERGKRLHSQGTHNRDGISSVAMGPGNLAATGGRDMAVQLMDGKTGQILHRMTGHSAPVRALAFSPDGSMLASGALDGTIRVWDARTGKPLDVFPSPRDGVHALGFDANARDLWCLCTDGARRLRVDESTITKFGGHNNFVYAVAFAPDGRTLATGPWKGPGQMIDTARGTVVRQIGPFYHPRFRFTPDGVLWGKSGLLAPPDWKIEPHPGRSGGAVGVAVSRDGSLVASGAGSGGSVRVFLATDGVDLARWTDLPAAVRALAISADNGLVAIGMNPGHLQVRSIATGEIVLEEKLAGGIESVAFHPSRNLLAVGGYEQAIKIWDVDGRRLYRQLNGHYGVVWTLQFHPSGTRLFSGSHDATIRVWDPETGLEKLRLEGHEGYVMDLDLTPDGKTLASGSGDFTARIWSSRPMVERFKDGN
ncbi:MAG: protein kinase domain-containing protein [Planctomycetota bacterium]